MRLSEIFKALASAELSNRYMADGGIGQLKDDRRELVLRSINLGLTDLFTRFFLKRGFETILTNPTQKQYEVSHPDCLEIIKVQEDGQELINNVQFSLMDTKTIYLVHPNDGQITVVYKANHRKLTEQDITLDSEVELPQVYLNALCLFVASRIFVSIPNQLDGDLNEGQRYHQKYLAEINHLTNAGVDVDDLDEMWLFNQRGFV